ncbi:MAG: ribonuclease III [Patescibacteria group bacterium]|nr:ribonuclease III [Patescibacteria group bacterium]
MKDLKELEKKLKIKFKNKDLLTQAFVHRSYLNENPEFALSNNERLEFLGDAVLELVVTKELFKKYPDKSEGDLTAWRASLVNAKMLVTMANEMNFSSFLLLSRGEKKEQGKGRDYILANTFEAFIGAIYLDQGLKTAEKLIIEHLMPKLPDIIDNGLFMDGKSTFQEKAQEKVQITPTYKVLKEWGPDHARHFTIGVFLNKEKAGEGEGSSKQEAEVKAAENAIKEKGW